MTESFSAHREDFAKLGSEIFYLFLAEKESFVCLFCLFVAILSPILVYIYIYKKIEALTELRKMLRGKKSMFGSVGNCSTLRVLRASSDSDWLILVKFLLNLGFP